MKKIFFVIAFVGLIVSAQAQNPLADLANSMQPGQWATLATNNESVLLNPGSSATSIIIPYAMTMAYDSVRKQVHFIGGDHAGGSDPATGFNHVRYDLATNAWLRMGHPSWYVASPYNDAHGYDLITINSAGRKLYRLPYNSNIVRVFNLDTDDTTNPANWTTLPAPQQGNYVMDSIEWFPERSILVVFFSSGSIQSFSETSQTWAEIGWDGTLSSTWNWTIYSPTLHELLIGSSTNVMWTVDALLNWTHLANIPAPYRAYDGTGFTGLWTNDPATGHFLILTDPTNGTGRNLYDYDAGTNTYTAKTSPPDKHPTGNFTAVPIPEYGVTMFAWAVGSGSTGVYLYKNGNAAPPPNNQAPTVNAGPDATIPGVFSATFSLTGTATDDPTQTLSYLWTLVSGPGAATIATPASLTTSVTVGVIGVYTFRLTVSDGSLSASDDVVRTVTAPVAFLDKCVQPGVVRCMGFDQSSDVAGRYGMPTGLLPAYGTTRYPELDATIKASGNSSLKFTIPPQSGSDTAGTFFMNFADDFSIQFDAGQSFYYQWRQRFSPEFITAIPNGQFKQAIMGTGSTGNNVGWPGIMASCSALELVAQNTFVRGFAQLYNSCSGSTSHGPYAPFEEQYGTYDFKLQNARPSPYCLYSQTHTTPSTAFPPTGNCFGYFPNEWMTFEVGVTLGSRIADEFAASHIQMWAAREGQPSELLQDWIFNLTAGPATDNPLQRFGQIFLTPYMTGKDPTVTNPIAFTWYDDLIVSREPIAMLASTVVPPLPPQTGDTTPPTIKFVTTAPSVTINSNDVIIRVAPLDNVGVVRVELYRNGKVDPISIASEAKLPVTTYLRWQELIIPAGTYTLTVYAYDEAGNKSAPATLTVIRK